MEPLENTAPRTASPTDSQRGPSDGGSNRCANSKPSGTNAASTSPMSIPPNVNSSGRMRPSRSEAINVMRIAENSEYFNAGSDGPKAATQTANAAAVVSSTRG